MIVSADVKQLYNEGLYCNIVNEQYFYLGVMTNHHTVIQCIYRDKKYKTIKYCMLFKNKEGREEFEKKHKQLECIIEFDENGEIK